MIRNPRHGGEMKAGSKMARRRVQDQGELASTNGSHYTEPHPPSSSEEAHQMAEAEVALEARKKEIAARRTDHAHSQSDTTVRNVANVAPASTSETISVTWGEELFTPVQFCSFRVGPFSASTTLRAGESREQAADRLMRELERIAAKERELKTRVYKDSLGPIIGKKVS